MAVYENPNYGLGDPNRYNVVFDEPIVKSHNIDNTVFINNIITIYDINGNIIKQYDGKYAILEHSSNKIIFADEQGYKHTIHISTGLITIDQKY